MAVIKELFLSLGYNVFRYGMENTVPGIMELLKGVRGDVATNIRRMPDFVIQHPLLKLNLGQMKNSNLRIFLKIILIKIVILS